MSVERLGPVREIAPDETALVTGASRGIGRAIAVELARLGFRVAVNYVRNEAAADKVVREICARGGDAAAMQGDVGRSEDRGRLVRAVLDRFGRIDLLVNNAAMPVPARKDLLDLEEEAWDVVLAVNLKGAFFLAQRVAREMIRLRQEGIINRGCIINISSVSAYAVSVDRAAYCVAKAGLEMCTQLLAVRLAGENIRVYQIRPGVIRTDMTAPVQEKYDRMFEQGFCPINRWGTPEDVARAVALLAAAELPYSTGETINVDGGFHIRRL